MLILLILLAGVAFADEKSEYINDALPKIEEAYEKTRLPDYKVPLFKVATRFQGSSIIFDNKPNKTMGISVTMIDMQLMRYSPLFGILRVFTQSPFKASPVSEQADPFIRNLNNTTIGIGGGGGWYVYDSRKAATGKGTSILLSFFGFYNLGLRETSSHTGKEGGLLQIGS